jgi:predicted Fe-Mo cluster-binding NifX family protein
MRTAIVAEGSSAAHRISDSFARCAGFLLVDEQGPKQFYPNPGRDLKEHAGVTAVEFLNEMGINLIIGYEFGSRVREIADARKIQLVILGEPDLTLGHVIKMMGFTI